jgi:hypothetical protein
MQARYQATLQPEQGRVSKPLRADCASGFFASGENAVAARKPFRLPPNARVTGGTAIVACAGNLSPQRASSGFGRPALPFFMPAPTQLPLRACAALLLIAAVCVAQPFQDAGGRGGGRRNGGGGGGGFGGGFGGGGGSIVRLEGGVTVNQDTVRTARETDTHSVGLPNWTLPPQFKADTFTFARLVFRSSGGGGGRGDAGGGFGGGGGRGRGGGGGRGLGWWVDYPDADLNLSARLQQLTSLKVDPDARVVRLTDPDLTRYPFLYTVHVEGIDLPDNEVAILGKYLRTGGVLMVSDFWGTAAWNRLAAQMQRVLPGVPWVDLPPDHPVFHGVFDLKLPLANLQIPTKSGLNLWNRAYNPDDPASRATLPRTDDDEMHVRAWLDDKGRIMVIALHNTDISDGWEREGEIPEYYKMFSETRAYPIAINVLFHLMTH